MNMSCLTTLNVKYSRMRAESAKHIQKRKKTAYELEKIEDSVWIFCVACSFYFMYRNIIVSRSTQWRQNHKKTHTTSSNCTVYRLLSNSICFPLNYVFGELFSCVMLCLQFKRPCTGYEEYENLPLCTTNILIVWRRNEKLRVVVMFISSFDMNNWINSLHFHLHLDLCWHWIHIFQKLNMNYAIYPAHYIYVHSKST